MNLSIHWFSIFSLSFFNFHLHLLPQISTVISSALWNSPLQFLFYFIQNNWFSFYASAFFFSVMHMLFIFLLNGENLHFMFCFSFCCSINIAGYIFVFIVNKSHKKTETSTPSLVQTLLPWAKAHCWRCKSFKNRPQTQTGVNTGPHLLGTIFRGG